MKKFKRWMAVLLVLLAIPVLLSFYPWLHVPRTVQFDASLPFTEINGYKFHTEIFGSPDAMPVIVVHGGPGGDYEYLRSLQAWLRIAASSSTTREGRVYLRAWIKNS